MGAYKDCGKSPIPDIFLRPRPKDIPNLLPYARSSVEYPQLSQRKIYPQYYDTSTGRLKTLEAGDYMEPGKGYYIHAQTDCVWEVPL